MAVPDSVVFHFDSHLELNGAASQRQLPAQAMAKFAFVSLSSDVQIAILAFLPAKELAAASACSKTLRALASIDRLWKPQLLHTFPCLAADAGAESTSADVQIDIPDSAFSAVLAHYDSIAKASGRARISLKALYGRWAQKDDCGSSRIVFAELLRISCPPEEERLFILEGKTRLNQQHITVLSLADHSVRRVPCAQLHPLMVPSHLRVTPLRTDVALYGEYTLRRERLARSYRLVVVGGGGVAGFLFTLLLTLRVDNSIAIAYPLAFLPLLLYTAVVIPYIAWHRSHSRTVDEAVITLLAGAGILIQQVLLALRLDGSFASWSAVQTMSTSFALYGFAMCVGVAHGISANALRRTGEDYCCAFAMADLRYIARYVAMYIAAFILPMLTILLLCLRADSPGSGIADASFFALLSPLDFYLLFVWAKIAASWNDASYHMLSNRYRFIKQLDFRYLHVLRGSLLVLAVSLGAGTLTLTLRLDNLVPSWSYTLACLPLLLFFATMTIFALWRVFGDRTKELYEIEHGFKVDYQGRAFYCCSTVSDLDHLEE